MDSVSIPVWQSYVHYKEKCFFVSTIERTYDNYQGTVRGLETCTWNYDAVKRERGDLIHTHGGLRDHQTICRCLIAYGEIPDDEDKRWIRIREGQV